MKVSVRIDPELEVGVISTKNGFEWYQIFPSYLDLYALGASEAEQRYVEDQEATREFLQELNEFETEMTVTVSGRTNKEE